MKLGNCPDCNSDDVEICSGDLVICNACGYSDAFETWQLISQGQQAFEAGSQEWADWNANALDFGDDD